MRRAATWKRSFDMQLQRRSGSFDKRRKVRSGPEDENEVAGRKGESKKKKCDVMSSFERGSRAFTGTTGGLM